MPRQRHRGIIVVAGLMNAFLGTSLAYSTGIIHFGLLGKYRRSPIQVSWASALFSSTFYLAGKKSIYLSIYLLGVASKKRRIIHFRTPIQLRGQCLILSVRYFHWCFPQLSGVFRVKFCIQHRSCSCLLRYYCRYANILI